jgi:hypothetical protein
MLFLPRLQIAEIFEELINMLCAYGWTMGALPLTTRLC